jgi:hypothetical protein
LKKWNDKEFPESIQKAIDNFADWGKSREEQVFRAGFYIGLNSKKIKEELGIAD